MTILLINMSQLKGSYWNEQVIIKEG